MLTFRIDPNRVRDHNRIATRLTHATSPFVLVPQSGDWVKVIDDEGNMLLAVVETVDTNRVHLKIDWSTLQPGAPRCYFDTSALLAAAAGNVMPTFSGNLTVDSTH